LKLASVRHAVRRPASANERRRWNVWFFKIAYKR
jgi:hypothetical protein